MSLWKTQQLFSFTDMYFLFSFMIIDPIEMLHNGPLKLIPETYLTPLLAVNKTQFTSFLCSLLERNMFKIISRCHC